MTLDPTAPTVLKKLTCGSDDAPVWLRVGTLLDGTSAPRSRVHVVYNAEAILYVGEEVPPADLTQGKSSPDVSLDDYTLMPGLIDAHTHVFLDGAPFELEVRKAYLQQGNDAVLTTSRGRLAKLMSTGVLAMRDGGDNRGVGLKLAAEYREAMSAGRSGGSPYIDSPGPGINKQGRYGSFMCEPVENDGSPESCVAGRVERGADRIKLVATGIINFKKGAVTAPPQMDQAELCAFAAAAGKHGRSTFAHASGDEGIEHVIEAGIDSVEHAYFVRDDQLDRMADRQIAWVPTLAPVQIQIDAADVMGWSDEIVDHLKRIVENHMKSLAKARDLGVPIVAGSDAGSCGVAHGLGFIYELELMEKAGLDPLFVLNSATGRSEEHIGYAEKIGRLIPGHRPRMILTPHRPQDGVAALYRDKTILFDGDAQSHAADITPEGL